MITIFGTRKTSEKNLNIVIPTCIHLLETCQLELVHGKWIETVNVVLWDYKTNYPKYLLLHMLVMPPPLGARGIMFLGCPSVRPKPEIPSIDLYMGPLVHSTNRDHFTAKTFLQRTAAGSLEEMLQEEPLGYWLTPPWDEQSFGQWLLGPWYMKLVPWFKPRNQCVSSWLKTSHHQY